MRDWTGALFRHGLNRETALFAAPVGRSRLPTPLNPRVRHYTPLRYFRRTAPQPLPTAPGGDRVTTFPGFSNVRRSYPGGLADLSRARRDLARDLRGFDPDLVGTVQLCLNELHANACKYGHPRGPVLCQLTLEGARKLSLTVFNQPGPDDSEPRIPTERSADEWDWAEGQRGLLLVQNLADGWGHHTWPRWSGLGTLVWADFHLPARHLHPV